ncbi:type IV pili methyl-accepting chemotaxis transducer N-terminal domain-containing protein [Serratia ureilytica]
MTGSLARALFGIVILSVLATGLALTTVAGSQSDAEAINIAGSLRMQSYRLAFDLERQSPGWSCTCSSIGNLCRRPRCKAGALYVPAEVRNHYLALQRTWQTMERQIRDGQAAAYRAEVAGYVNRVDHFVSALQRYSELKLTWWPPSAYWATPPSSAWCCSAFVLCAAGGHAAAASGRGQPTRATARLSPSAAGRGAAERARRAVANLQRHV